MEKVCQEGDSRLERKSLLPQPYSGPTPTRDHVKVVIESEKVISTNLEKTL